LHRKVALVTGGSRGLGAAIARGLVESGADVAITYRRSADAAATLVDQFKGLGVRAAAFQADQAEPDQVTRMVDEVAGDFGSIDILVNNAASFQTGTLGALSHADIAHQWAVNVLGTVVTTQEAVAHMLDNGRVINISSVAGDRAATAGFGDYSATRAAVAAYGRAWAHELAPRGIMVNTVVATVAETGVVVPADSDTGKYTPSLLPQRRYARPAEVAEAVVFLASSDSSYMTGGTISVEGDWNV
jgi:3-oxoacyl-[acyl-carrier protein] reductase